MDKEFYQATETACNRLASQIEETVPACRVNNLGFQLIIMFDNKSVATVYPLTADTVDLYAKDFRDEEYDLKNLSVQQCIQLLRELASLTEETSATGAVDGYSPAAAPGQKSNRGTQQSEREGWTVADPNDPKNWWSEKYPIGHVSASRQPISELGSRLEHPFGEDALGQEAMNDNRDKKKHSEGKRVNKISHNFENGSPLSLGENSGEIEDNSTLAYLREMLPCETLLASNALVFSPVGSIGGENKNPQFLVRQQDSGNFSVIGCVNDEPISDISNVTAGQLIKWCFEVVNKVQERFAEAEADKDEMEVDPGDVWETLREYAKEAGHSTDILRNKNLFDLKQGLTCAKSPFVKKENEQPKTETSGSKVKGDTMHNGSPVSLNESRDASRPYADTLGGRKLIYLPGIGATLVDKKDLPKGKFLSWNSSTGQVELVEGRENVKRPSWFFRGWKH